MKKNQLIGIIVLIILFVSLSIPKEIAALKQFEQKQNIVYKPPFYGTYSLGTIRRSI